MKRVFSMLVALTVAVMSYSQSRLVATLSHNGEISAYYGASALQEAYEAAEHGDIITLSSGTFASVEITKALTIRGAGMYVDSLAQILPTVISGGLTINITDDVEQQLTIEGIYNDHSINIYNTLEGVAFLKSRINCITYGGGNSEKKGNITFVHCKILDYLNINDNSFATCVNSYIQNPYTSGNPSSNFDFLNCFIETNYISNIQYSSLTNCIINSINVSGGPQLPPSTIALYCLGKDENGFNIFSNTSNTTNTNFTDELSTLFKTYTGTYNDAESFELTDMAKGLYLGNDLTEVGMYGGNYPFNPTPSYPQIVKFNVASESTADGKLSVDIEVSSGK